MKHVLINFSSCIYTQNALYMHLILVGIWCITDDSLVPVKDDVI